MDSPRCSGLRPAMPSRWTYRSNRGTTRFESAAPFRATNTATERGRRGREVFRLQRSKRRAVLSSRAKEQAHCRRVREVGRSMSIYPDQGPLSRRLGARWAFGATGATFR